MSIDLDFITTRPMPFKALDKKTDYISRSAFKEEVRRLSTHYLNEWSTLGVLAAVDRIPAADVREVKRGKWIEKERAQLDEIVIGSFLCDNCNLWSNAVWQFGEVAKKPNFCPNCGAF